MSPFPEEQLDSPVGYFAAQQDQSLHNGRWSIIRKLGWGPRSSTWLAVDSQDSDNIEAIKIFTVNATNDSSALNELNILQGPLKEKLDGFPVIRDHFYETSAKGRHLCLVLHVLGPSVESFRLTNPESVSYLPIHIVRKIVADILEPLSELHASSIIHGALTPDNFLFLSEQQGDDIRQVISTSPPIPAEKVVGSDGTEYPVLRSQPIGHQFKWNDSKDDFAEASIYLSNFGHARFIHNRSIPPDVAKGIALSPEILRQDEKVDQKSDIWALGIATYLLLTGTPLFSVSSLDHYQEVLPNLEKLLISSNKVSTNDLPSTLSFLKSCLDLDASSRPSAFDLLGNDWVLGEEI